MAAFLKNQRDGLQYRYFQKELEHKEKKRRASVAGRTPVEWMGEKTVLETEMGALLEKMQPDYPLH